MANLNFFAQLAFLIVVAGGLNWGLISIGGKDWNVAEKIDNLSVRRAVYAVIGLSALALLANYFMSPSSD